MRIGTLTLLACSSLLACAAAPAKPDASAPAIVDAPKPTLRLPTGVRPLRAQLFLDLDPARESTSGRVVYQLQLDQPQSLLWINATELAISAAELDGAPLALVAGDADLTGLRPAHPIAAGSATLTLSFTGKVDRERSRGIYRGDEGADAFLYTFFEPIDARRAFPCFDEPGAKIPWTLSLRVPRASVALANTAVAEEKENGDGTKTVRFLESRPLPSYLVAFAVGPFELLDGGVAGNFKTPFRIALPKGRAAEAAYALQSTPRIISILEDYFGMPYPYGKLDVLVVPRYWGTMEHPGLVALGQPISLIKPEDLTVARKQFYVDIGGHELGHYWFGDYVTMGFWDDTWLNEALGEWMDAKLTSTFDPSWNFMLDRLAETNGARAKDGLASTKSIRQPVVTKEDIESSFDAQITYEKGSAVLRMFEEWVGEEKWRGFIRAYLAAHAWGNATTEEFIATLSAQLSPEVAAAFRTFLEQPGLPVISADVRCGAAPHLLLRQSRYRPLGQSDADELWQVPVCFRSDLGRQCVLLKGEAQEVPLASCPQWVELNDGAIGYYRVGHAPGSSAALLPHLDAAEANQLASDVGAGVRAGTFPLAEALALVPPLVARGERHAIQASVGLTRQLNPRELDDALYRHYRAFIERTYGARARALGWVPAAGEPQETAQLRAALVGLVAFVGEDPELVAGAQKLAEVWLARHAGVSDDLVDEVLAIAAQHGDRALFDRMLAQAKEPGLDRRDRSRLLAALGSFRQPELARAALEALPGFDLREGLALVWSVLTSRENREQGWQALQKGYDSWVPRMRGDEAGGMIGAVGIFCDERHRAEAAAFFSERAKTIDGGPRNLANALDAVDSCIAVRRANEAAVARFLEQQ